MFGEAPCLPVLTEGPRQAGRPGTRSRVASTTALFEREVQCRRGTKAEALPTGGTIVQFGREAVIRRRSVERPLRGRLPPVPVLAERQSKPPFGSREEFRASAGARKSPRKLTFGYKELSVSKRTLNILPLS